jgi:hypothetical protein
VSWQPWESPSAGPDIIYSSMMNCLRLFCEIEISDGSHRDFGPKREEPVSRVVEMWKVAGVGEGGFSLNFCWWRSNSMTIRSSTTAKATLPRRRHNRNIGRPWPGRRLFQKDTLCAWLVRS